jgi:hypothetical protein
MKKLLLLSLMAIAIQAQAQNVGIGNPTPAEKLDITGNINVTGTIKANGVDGSAGQLLMKNQSGLLSWGDACDYKNFKQFFAEGIIQSWIVPTNVTKIMAEIWSAGGGGSGTGSLGNGAGGGGGGYAKVLIPVTPGANVFLSVGLGGIGGDNTGSIAAQNGQQSYISISPILVSVIGGQGASTSSFGYGSTTYDINVPNFIFVRGHAGEITNTVYSQATATEFRQQNYYGKGGDAANNPASGGLGGYYNLIVGSSALIKPGSNGQGFGGGGGGHHSGGQNGAPGTIIIYY